MSSKTEIGKRASRRGVLAGLGAAMAAPTVALAAADPVILTIGGLVAPPAPRRFTFAEIEALGTVGFETATPWYPGRCRFDGVRLDRLTETVGGRGATMRIEALNDYAADIAVAELAELRPILATRRDGAPMPVSDKGPLFVVYPFDDLPKARHHAVFSRSVWQVSQIVFR